MVSIKFYRKFSNPALMKKSWKKPGTIRWIKNISLTFAQQQGCFELLKSKVQTGQKVMVAVSGGADSILTACLMYNFFLKNKCSLQNLFFIHCNHHTRTGNTADEQFIGKFFKGTQLIIVKRASSKKVSEAELRNRRYGEFKKYAKKEHINQFIFGHNLTDRIESTFLNLLRGANLNGFSAMQVQEDHHLLWWTKVLRPILWLTKDEVTEICKKNKIPFVTDPTNKDTTTSLRNKLRNKVLSGLYKLANKQTKTTNSFIESMKNIYITLEKPNRILNPELWFRHQALQPELKSINRSPHRNADFAYQRMIDPNDVTNEWMMQVMKKLHISNNVTTPLLNELTKFLTNSESGYKYFNKTYIFKSHGNIYIISAPKWFREKTVDSQKKIDNLTVQRFPRKGDRYKGKTRNEWCINQKIPIFRRNFIPIVVKKNQIIKIFRS